MNAKQDYTVAKNETLQTWHVRYYVDGKRKSHQLGNFCDLTEEQAKAKAKSMWRALTKTPAPAVPLVRDLVAEFAATEMSDRFSTRRSYDAWLRNHILPRWGDSPITELQALEVRDWLRELALGAKSKAHIKGLVSQLWAHAMLHRYVDLAVNPMALFKLKGTSTERRKPRSLTVEEFQKFFAKLDEPVRTIALTCVCLGLRISECLALKWSDVDWFKSELTVQRGIVMGRVGEVKTEGSRRTMALAPEMIAALKARHQATEFSGPEDWIFASPISIGRNPISYPWVWKSFQIGARKAGVGTFGTHTMRHSYRSWLDAAGTPIAVQQKLMRHSDIRTTMNTYGNVVTDELVTANLAVAKLAIQH